MRKRPTLKSTGVSAPGDPLHTMAQLVTLFEYAELMTGIGRKAAVEGELRLRPDGDGAAKFGKTGRLVHGELKQITLEKFKKLQTMERRGVDYEPVKVITTDGVSAMAFQFAGKGWETFRTVPSGHWSRRALP